MELDFNRANYNQVDWQCLILGASIGRLIQSGFEHCSKLYGIIFNLKFCHEINYIKIFICDLTEDEERQS